MQSKPENYLTHNSVRKTFQNATWFFLLCIYFCIDIEIQSWHRAKDVTERDMKDEYFHDKLIRQNYGIL